MGQKYRIHGLPDFSFSLKFTDGETMITRLITVTTKQQWDFLCRASGRVKGTNVKRFMSKYLTLIAMNSIVSGIIWRSLSYLSNQSNQSIISNVFYHL